MDYKIVYWSGVPFKEITIPLKFKSISHHLQKDFSKNPPGLYSIKLEFLKQNNAESEYFINPKISKIIPINDQLLKDTYFAINKSKKFPRIYPKLVGNLEKWIENTFSKFNNIKIAYEFSKNIENPSAIWLEEIAFWLGMGNRPSESLGNKEIEKLINNVEDLKISKKSLYLLAGKKGAILNVPFEYKDAYNFGAFLKFLPFDILIYLYNLKKNKKIDLQLVKDFSSDELSIVFSEFYFLDSIDFFSGFIKNLYIIIEEIKEYIKEPEKRKNELLEYIKSDLDNYLKKPDKTDFVFKTKKIFIFLWDKNRKKQQNLASFNKHSKIQ